MNTVKMFMVDDADKIFANRHDATVLRLSESVKSTQYVFTIEKETEKVASVADNIMSEAEWFDFYPDEDEDND